MPVMRKPIGSKDVLGDNLLTRLFPGDTPDPTAIMGGPLVAAGAGESGPLAQLIMRIKAMLGNESKVPANIGDSILRSHELDSRISGIEPKARSGVPGLKTPDQAKEEAYQRMMQNGSQRTTPELRNPGATQHPDASEFQKFLDILRNRKQGQ